MDSARDVVDGLRGVNQFLRFFRTGLARIAECCEHAAIVIQALYRRFVCNGDENQLAAFLGLADAPHLHARRCLGERIEVLVDVRRTIQIAGCADDVAEHLERRRHGSGVRQVIHQLRRDARILQILPYLRRVCGVDSLLRAGMRGKQQRGAGGERAEDLAFVDRYGHRDFLTGLNERRARHRRRGRLAR